MNEVTFVVRRKLNGTGWIIRSQSTLGEGAVGPRLAKGSSFPSEFGITFDDKCEADEVAVKWNDWYGSQKYLIKKRRTKYLA